MGQHDEFIARMVKDHGLYPWQEQALRQILNGDTPRSHMCRHRKGGTATVWALVQACAERATAST